MKTKSKIIGIVALVGIALAVAMPSLATITANAPIGGNDNAVLQLWSFPTTVVGGSAATNAPNGLDISSFDQVTVWMVTTNDSALSVTNILKVYRALDSSGNTTETAPYITISNIVAASTYNVYQTNLVANDIAGQGFLYATLIANTSAGTTNGSGTPGSVYTNVWPFQAGIEFKIKHALR